MILVYILMTLIIGIYLYSILIKGVLPAVDKSLEVMENKQTRNQVYKLVGAFTILMLLCKYA